MRVITGIAKKKPLLSLSENFLRPTTQKVKEAIFSIIQLKIENSVVLDLFSGSGQLGIEALSQGAKHCTFVDISKKAHTIEIKNLKSTNLEKKATVVLSEGLKFIKKTKENFDIIFLDPPYEKTELLKKAVELSEKKLKNNGIIICEHKKCLNMTNCFENISLQKQYCYGRIKLSIYTNSKNQIRSVEN